MLLNVPLNTLIHKSGFLRIKSQFSGDDVCSEPVPSISFPIPECAGANQNNSGCSFYISFHFQPVFKQIRMAIYVFCFWNQKRSGIPCGVLRFINYQQLLNHCFVLHVWICHCLLSIFCPALLCVTPSSNSMSNRLTVYNWVRKLLFPFSGVCVFSLCWRPIFISHMCFSARVDFLYIYIYICTDILNTAEGRNAALCRRGLKQTFNSGEPVIMNFSVPRWARQPIGR